MSYQHEPYYSKQLVCGLVSVKATSYHKVTLVVPNGHYTDMRGAFTLACYVVPECTLVNVEWDSGELVNVYAKRGDKWECVFRDH